MADARTEVPAVDATTTSAGVFSLPAPEGQSRVSRDIVDLSRSNGQFLSDELLLSLVRDEDRNALGLLFRRYAGSLYAIGRRILKDASEAEDLVQEVFLYIHTKSAQFDSSKGTARSWIFQIAYTQAFLRRRALKHHGLYSQGIGENMGETETIAKPGADYDQTPEGLFGRNGWRKILELLTEDQRETLRLHFFEGCTFAEIAEKLGQSYVNVRNHYYRGLEKVRKHLGDRVLSRR
jgi:RNA polymerase sigma-70 factor (ECF subfamily)